jgi:hypothetical protein
LNPQLVLGPGAIGVQARVAVSEEIKSAGRGGLPARVEVVTGGCMVAAMTELISAGPPVAVALAIAVAAALVVRRLAFAKRGSDE